MNQPSAPCYYEHPYPVNNTEEYYIPQPAQPRVIYVQQPTYYPPPRNSCLPILELLLCFCCLENCL